jgi:hypothetical protein
MERRAGVKLEEVRLIRCIRNPLKEKGGKRSNSHSLEQTKSPNPRGTLLAIPTRIVSPDCQRERKRGGFGDC